MELAVDLVQIKGLWIKCATDPVHHLLMLGVLRILYRVQKARVPPETTAILQIPPDLVVKSQPTDSIDIIL